MYNISIMVMKTLNDAIDNVGNEPATKREKDRFNNLTRFKTVVMGRKTYNDFGALPNRVNIVMSKSNINFSELNSDGVLVVKSLDFVLEMSKKQEVFILGGGEIFNQFLPYANKVYLTIINKEVEGELFLKIHEEDWGIAHEDVINDNVKLQILVRKSEREIK